MSDKNESMGDLFPDLGPEAPVISGVAHDRSEALATVRGVPNEPGMAAKVFTELAMAGVNVDMIVQAGRHFLHRARIRGQAGAGDPHRKARCTRLQVL